MLCKICVKRAINGGLQGLLLSFVTKRKKQKKKVPLLRMQRAALGGCAP